MKAYYYENNGYNGILLTNGDKWISHADAIDGIEINRENVPQIVKNLSEYGYNADDFETAYAQQIGTLFYGKGVENVLEEQEYTQEIYSA